MKTILVLTDFSRESSNATLSALKLAERAEAQLWLYQAFEYSNERSNSAAVSKTKPVWSLSSQLIRDLKKHNEELLKNKEMENLSSGSCFVCSSISMMNIEKLLSERDIWVIISTSKSEADVRNCFVFGSNTYNVIDHATCPVLLIPDTTAIYEVNKIVCDINLNKIDINRMLHVVEFAKLFNSEIIISDMQSRTYLLDLKEARRKIEQIKEIGGYKEIKTLEGEPATQMAEYCCKEGVDLLAVVYREKAFYDRILNHRMMSSTNRNETIPLLVLPKC